MGNAGKISSLLSKIARAHGLGSFPGKHAQRLDIVVVERCTLKQVLLEAFTVGQTFQGENPPSSISIDLDDAQGEQDSESQTPL